VVDLEPTRAFRLIFQISAGDVLRTESDEGTPSHELLRAGSIITSFTERPERIRIVGAADTLQLLFSPELAAARGAKRAVDWPLRRDLLASTVQTLVATSLDGTDTQLRQTVAAVAKLVVEQHRHQETSAGGLTPQARRVVLELVDKRLSDGISVPELADAASLSLHHFIKVCRQSEGLTPHALLIEKRIERAIEILLEGMATVDEVAIQVGFFSPSHFISTFRRLVGVTPAALRRAARD
jgi:AraC-like DNA-binding protein